MSLHPIRVLDSVIDEYRDYLLTEFRAKELGLRAALEGQLDAAGFLAQESFYQAHRPFVPGSAWRDVPIEPKLARVMEQRSRSATAFRHQALAIEELRKDDARPVVVTTGTGSGKSEAFLLPVIQNAFEDAVRYKKAGLTAILVYPMNALANDQRQRIGDYLHEAGLAGAVRVEQYDRSTPRAKREEMQQNPPHILLTNYMMLEYLLVRPADRDGIFANHRCRYVALDEVHTYRGTLGSNIALLIRRLRVHLREAPQDWKTDVDPSERRLRFPSFVPVGTSATIKSLTEEGKSHEELIRLRDEAVQEFFGTLTGVDPQSIRVFGEELQDLQVPPEARYPSAPAAIDSRALNVEESEAVRRALCALAGVSDATPLAEAATRCRLLWDLNLWLIRRPMSVSQLVAKVRSEVPDRATAPLDDVRKEVEAALLIGAALPDSTPGALRLRAHRFLRGGWKFRRCIDPACGRLYPADEETCGCGRATAPLFLCRNCGADYLRFVGDPAAGPLATSSDDRDAGECLLYVPSRFQQPPIDDEDEDQDDAGNGNGRQAAAQAAAPVVANVRNGSFDPATRMFSDVMTDYPLQVALTTSRTRCLCCGGTAGSRSVLTRVALGTSAAVKVLGEGLAEALKQANREREGHDGKERLLIFSDSRQDAAHQARFIVYASRYDRLRRRIAETVTDTTSGISIQRLVERLAELGDDRNDNPHRPEGGGYISEQTRERMQAWEEAPLLDDIAVNAGYRGTFVNLGLVGVQYEGLVKYAEDHGPALAQRLGVTTAQLAYLCRVLLDDMRTRGALSRKVLRYHSAYTAYPREFQAAQWERRVKAPKGYPLGPDGETVETWIDPMRVPKGISLNNAWRRAGAGGRSPSTERVMRNLMLRFGGAPPDEHAMREVLEFLARGNQFLTRVELYGARDRMKLLQVNEDVVRLVRLNEATRRHCNVCGDVRAWTRVGDPCPRCHGQMVQWKESEIMSSRSLRRIVRQEVVPLVAAEHTAQVPGEVRADIEEKFKAEPAVSPLNVLACSPTLEMGIDVGGLDAVVMRNVPPRPDNYAQRGGRAGRRTRVGMVVSYARSTPHDQYFYDRPEDMIAGEVPAPLLSLGNRDVIVRHLYAVAFGAAEPGLSGRMAEYVTPRGDVNHEQVEALVAGVTAQSDYAVRMALAAWGEDVLAQSGFTPDDLRAKLNELPDRIRHAVNVTALQVATLRQALDRYADTLDGRHAGTRAGDLVARLLGIPTGNRQGNQDADDRSAGYPLRRFAEFGLLPGYEFPAEPAALRLLGDDREEDAITVARRFGIGQFQPNGHVYARGRRWRVNGLDMSSPWNPRTDGPTWTYRVCRVCDLHYDSSTPRCPRCGDADISRAYPGYEYGGFLAVREERPILDEEERYAERNLVSVEPQWDGNVVGRWSLPNGWTLHLRRNEQVRWVNEGVVPAAADPNVLHPGAKGYRVCGTCGHLIDDPAPQAPAGNRGRRNARRVAAQNQNGHAAHCGLVGVTTDRIALVASGREEVLRLMLPLPRDWSAARATSFGLSLGYALLYGMQRHFMLDSAELDFVLEGPWSATHDGRHFQQLSLAFVDVNLGGSGYLERVAATAFDAVARRTIEHLDHPNCVVACYRCLKGYRNQRFHDQLSWPQTIPALEDLASAAPITRPLQATDVDDPGAWLEAFEAGVGSPLELKFWRLFQDHGFTPEKQVPVSVGAGGPVISIADFAVPDRRLAIYVDSAAFHVGQNLRRDRSIRQRLADGQPSWRVVELRAADLSAGGELVARLLAD